MEILIFMGSMSVGLVGSVYGTVFALKHFGIFDDEDDPYYTGTSTSSIGRVAESG